MLLDVAPQLRQPVGTVSTFDLAEPSLVIDDTVLRDLLGSATLLRTNRGLLATVHIRATVRESCSRCLADTACVVDVDFAEEYIPTVDAVTGARVRLAQESDLFRIGPDFVLDLREGIRQYTLMNEPAKPLCKADCKGLCPFCGADLNQGPCGCRPPVDERWQTLSRLKGIDSEGS